VGAVLEGSVPHACWRHAGVTTVMKNTSVLVLWLLKNQGAKRNIKFLLKFCLVLLGLVLVYAFLFDRLMAWEGREHTFMTGIYWTLTTMSTLGFGDITFSTDLGRAFSVLVLLTGMVFLLVLFPFIIIEFVYSPIMRAQNAARTPTELAPDTKGHVILTSYDALTQAVIARLRQYQTSYVLVTPDIKDALAYHDMGLRVMLGDLDNPETYRNARVERAALVAATSDSDPQNTNIVFTVRELCEHVPIVSTVRSVDAVDILELAGSTQVLHLAELMGNALARCARGGGSYPHVLGQLGGVLMVEARATGTDWVGKTLAEANIKESLGINVAGVWERGRFELAGPQTRLTEQSTLVMGLSGEQLKRYKAHLSNGDHAEGLVLIIGGGTVGQATAKALRARKVNYRIVERVESRRGHDAEHTVIGDAADLEVLRRAGLEEAHTVIITTHSDDINVFLTIYCRRLLPSVQIICRTTHERNVATLHRAGADFVLSYASMGASAVFNHLQHGSVLMMVEGLYAKRIPIPPGIRGKSLIEAQVRARSGCSVVALESEDTTVVNPSPTLPMPESGHLILIVTPEAEERFLRVYGKGDG